MNWRKVLWAGLWLLSSLGVFGICMLLLNQELAGMFALAGIIIAVAAQIIFGSSIWATTGETTVLGRGGRFVMLASPTLMEKFTEERYKQAEKETEWSIGFGITVFGLLMFVFALLAFIFIRRSLGITG